MIGCQSGRHVRDGLRRRPRWALSMAVEEVALNVNHVDLLGMRQDETVSVEYLLDT
jgi:hypothetical protein